MQLLAFHPGSRSAVQYCLLGARPPMASKTKGKQGRKSVDESISINKQRTIDKTIAGTPEIDGFRSRWAPRDHCATGEVSACDAALEIWKQRTVQAQGGKVSRAIPRQTSNRKVTRHPQQIRILLFTHSSAFCFLPQLIWICVKHHLPSSARPVASSQPPSASTAPPRPVRVPSLVVNTMGSQQDTPRLRFFLYPEPIAACVQYSSHSQSAGRR